METRDLTQEVKDAALKHEADLVGIVKAQDLAEHEDGIMRILPSAKSILVVAARHSLAAIRSVNNEVAQFDTVHTYGQAERAAHGAARFLESKGVPSVAVPAFIPIDMSAPKKGMRGEICWRRAGVRAGLGTYGESGLLVTREFGAAVRISGVVTAAELQGDSPLEEDICDHCMRCVEVCPAEALSGQRRINKRKCGNEIFKYGFRYFHQLMEEIGKGSAFEIQEILGGAGLREIWQTFMTGNYYYCFKCQSQCPAERLYPPEERT